MMRCMKHIYIYPMRRAPRLLFAARLLRMLATDCMHNCMKFASPGRHQLNNSDSAIELTSLRVCSQLDHELNAVIADYS